MAVRCAYDATRENRCIDAVGFNYVISVERYDCFVLVYQDVNPWFPLPVLTIRGLRSCAGVGTGVLRQAVV